MDNSLNSHNGMDTNNSWGLLLITTFIGLFGVITASDFALICGGLAGISTFAYNIYKIYQEYKKRK